MLKIGGYYMEITELTSIYSNYKIKINELWRLL